MLDGWLRAYPDDRAGSWTMLEALVPHLDEACIGDTRGCVAQAWSVAESLRGWMGREPAEAMALAGEIRTGGTASAQ